ncbi:metallophosphoesterase [Campylobacter upsaliensis]|nr:hypothetical protein [Campylobacter upsaliensis]EAK1467573.1 hypothetical protein [Campylobacter upsaliensis]EJQ4960030.1 metallophosphoesterase [Campylobacter upsaliensis]ELE7458973.1 metallophosphoesterase [Campylobacter upsaliensis]ELY0805348.1 metallophosphoesterase [Campylobacter upsaliensis]
MNKIYFFGDTHGEIDIDKIFMPSYEKDDYIIVCGDFGVLWSDESGRYKQDEMLESEAKLKVRIQSLPCTLLFIDGNHENFNRLHALKQVKKFNANVGEYIKDKCFHLRRGQIYHIAGHHIFTMGGALSIDRLRRREFLSWWKQEAISEKELKEALWNIENYKDKIDIVVSHTCPESFLNPLSKQMNISHKIHDENPVKLQKIKEALEDNHQIPKYWICGHWHQDISFKVDTIDFNVLYYHCLCLDKEELKRLDFSEAIIKIKRDRRWGW